MPIALPAKIMDLGAQIAGGVVAAIGAAKGTSHPLIAGVALAALPHVVRILEAFLAGKTHDLSALVAAGELELPSICGDPAIESVAAKLSANLTPAERQTAETVVAATLKKITPAGK